LPEPDPSERLPSEARVYFVLGGLTWAVPVLIV
jgi:hypothetical protein